MTKREYAQILLETIDEKAPSNINWNLEEEWMSALMLGITRAELRAEGETKESQAAGTARDQRN